MRIFFHFNIAVMLLVIGMFMPVAQAQTIGRGYAEGDFRLLTQTYFSLYKGGNPTDEMLDKYAELAYCNLYRKNFSDDFEWAKIRNGIREDLQKHITNIPLHYQIIGTMKIGRYDFEKKAFPIANDYRHKNVGKLYVLAPGGYFSYCGKTGIMDTLPSVYEMVLLEPLNLQYLKIPEADAKKIVEYLNPDKEGNRKIYARYRLYFMDLIQVSGRKSLRAEFSGQIQSIDFFLDREATQKIFSIQYVSDY